MFQRIKMDLKHRFLNFETFGCLGLAIVGPIGLWMVNYQWQDALKLMMTTYFITITVQGIYGVFVNRIKQELRAERQCEEAQCFGSE